MKILVLGASGFIGSHLVAALEARSDEVRTSSLRDPQVAARTAEGSDAVINLAGAPIAQRWNEHSKREIETSRTELPHRFIDSLRQLQNPPKIYISASAIGYYGTSETTTFTETSPPGDNFLARVCREWEREAQRARELGMHAICIRTGLALGSDGGALQKMLLPFKLGAGGIIGNGKQWYSWVHIDDLIGIYLFALDNAARIESGALNATSPQPVTNAEFTKTLGQTLHRPTFLPTPTFALRAMLGEGATVVLEGQRVLPERTQSLGYTFKYTNLMSALDALSL
jgi:hypothetical protein